MSHKTKTKGNLTSGSKKAPQAASLQTPTALKMSPALVTTKPGEKTKKQDLGHQEAGLRKKGKVVQETILGMGSFNDVDVDEEDDLTMTTTMTTSAATVSVLEKGPIGGPNAMDD